MGFIGRLTFSLITLLIFSTTASANSGPRGFNVRGALFDPNGDPVSGNVSFILQILDKDSTCVLYEEDHVNVDLTNSDGSFSLNFSHGTNKANKIDSSTELKANVFNNSQNLPAFADCPTGVTLSSGDERKIRIIFNDGSGDVALTPDLSLQSTPYATVAETLQGYEPPDFLQVNPGDNVTQPNLNALMSGGNYGELLNLINGTSSNYQSGSPSSAVDNNGQIIDNLGTPSDGDDATNKNYVDQNLGGSTLDVAGVGPASGDGRVLTWDQTNNKWVASPASTLDSTKLPLTGGTMTGNIDMGGSLILSSGHITQSAQSTITIGKFTTAEQTTLVSSLTAANAGATWFNSDTGKLVYWDGTQALSVSENITGGGDFKADGSVAMTGDLNLDGQNILGLSLGSAASPSLSFDGDTNTGIFSPAGDSLAFSTAGNEALVIDSAGNVGIGSSTPSTALDVDGTVTATSFAGDGSSLTGVVASSVANNSVSTNQVVDNSLTADDLATDSVTASELADNAVDTNAILDDAVTADKLADTSVTAGSFGSATQVAIFTVDAQGRLTAASNTAITESDPGLQTLTTAEVDQLENIDTETISNAQWAFLGAMSGAPLEDVTGVELDNVFSSNGILIRTGANTYSITANNSSNWDTAFGWGDHGAAGYALATNVVAKSGDAMTGALSITGSTDAVQMMIQAHSTQTTNTNILELKDSSGTVIGSFKADGVATASTDLTTKSYVDSQVSGSGDVSNASNVGAGAGQIFRDKTSGTLNLKTIATGSTKLSVTNNANDITLDVTEANIDHDALSNFEANEHIDHSSVNVATAAGTSGLSGGGDLTATRNIAVDIAGTTDVASSEGSDSLLIRDNSDSGNLKEISRANFLSGYLTSVTGTELDNVWSNNGILVRTGANTYSQITDNSTNWNTAFGWGDHSLAGYATTTNALKIDGTNEMTGGLDLGGQVLEDLALGSAASPSLSFTGGDTNTGIFSPAGDSLAFSTAGNEALVINSAGNVGIGTTSPEDKFVVVGKALVGGGTNYNNSSRGELTVYNDSGDSDVQISGKDNTAKASLSFNSGSGSGVLYRGRIAVPTSSSNMQFLSSAAGGRNAGFEFINEQLSSSPIVTFHNSGNVGIGTTSPTADLSFNNSLVSPVAGSISAGDKISLYSGNDRNTIGTDPTGIYIKTGGRFKILHDNGTTITERLSILTDGNVGIGTTSPAVELDVHDGVINASSICDESNSNCIDLSSGVTTSASSESGTSTSGYVINTDSDNSGSDGGVDIQSNGSTVANITNLGNIQSTSGSSTSPGLSFTGDTNTGVFNPAADTLSMAAGGVEALRLNTVASGVNYVEITPAAAGSGPIIATEGADTNIDLNITPKGTGNTIFTNGNVGIGTTAPAGNLTVTDEASNVGVEVYPSATKIAYSYYDRDNTEYVDAVQRSKSYLIRTGLAAVQDRLIVTETGNVGIGTTTPVWKLNVHSTSDTVISAVTSAASGESPHFIGFKDRGIGVYPNAGESLSQFQGRDNVDRNFIAGMGVISHEDFSASEKGTYLNFVTAEDGTIVPQERMRIDHNGNVGIGTTTPGAKLSVTTSGAELGGTALSAAFRSNAGALGTIATNELSLASIGFTSPAGNNISLGARAYRTSSGTDWTSSSIGLGMDVDNTIRAGASIWLHGNGNVGIGTTSPTEKLHIDGGDIELTGDLHPSIDFTESDTSKFFTLGLDNSKFFIREDGSSGADEVFTINGGNVGIGTTTPSYKLHVNGSVAGVGAYNNLSDKRLKRDIASLSNPLENLLQIQGVTYDWRRQENPEIDFPEGKDMGVIAQDVQKVFPEAVVEDDKGILSVAYSKLIAPIIEAIRELSAVNHEQDREISSLKQENYELKKENIEFRKRLETIEKMLKK